MKASDFSYVLPAELIAQAPSPRRRDARLLHLAPSGAPIHRRFFDLLELLRTGDVLVLNETRVVPARLRVTRASGGAVEIFFLEELDAGTASPGAQDAPVAATPRRTWRALAKPAKRVRAGEVLTGGGGDLRLRVLSREGDALYLEAPEESAHDVLERWGEVPLPPYVRRPKGAPTDEDRERYQTVFARVWGAVAAPTAGLHFDEEMLDSLRERGIQIVRVVLHVGPGTFRPLPKEADLDAVRLDAERFEVSAESARAILEARARDGRIIACGTTVVRALETWARSGARGVAGDAPVVGARGETSLFIRPPFTFLAVDALVTNFHLPESSLLCLVAAFVGRDRLLATYEEAVRAGYRFYSYGDATFMERPA